MVELHAEWCEPCKSVSTTLAQIADKLDGVAYHRADVGQLPSVATQLGAQGLPYIAFMESGKVIHALPGTPSRGTIARTIKRLKGGTKPSDGPKGDGKLVEGQRVIEFRPGAETGRIFVFRGDTVRLVMRGPGYPYSVHIPALNVSGEASDGGDLELKFKARAVGTYSIFCNGDCPAGDGAAHATLVVMQYKGTDETVYRELTAKQAKEFIDGGNVVVLDVRTPMEYYDGHIKGAKLIPVQQLFERPRRSPTTRTRTSCSTAARATEAPSPPKS